MAEQIESILSGLQNNQERRKLGQGSVSNTRKLGWDMPPDLSLLVSLPRTVTVAWGGAYLFLGTAQLALDDEIESKSRPEAEEALNKLKEAFSGKMRRLEFVVDSALVLASLPSARRARKDRKPA